MNPIARLHAASTAPRSSRPHELPQYARSRYGDGHATEYDTWKRALRFRNQPEVRG
jgi:hypothetical protein